MLSQLKISHLAIVKTLELNYSEGLTVITGETGAGKSIMVDALALALGGRAEGNMVRFGEKRAEVVALFNCTDNKAALAWLKSHELNIDDQCILRRTISADGRSRAYINSTPTTIQSLKNLGELLVNIHGQHEHQTLLRCDTQRMLLDHYAKLNKPLAKLKQSFNNWAQCKSALQKLTESARHAHERSELLAYQLKELDELALQEGEIQQLELDHRRLANCDQIHQTCFQSLQLLRDNEQANAQQRLNDASRLLNDVHINDSKLESTRNFLDSISLQLEEASHDLSQYMESIENNPEQLQNLDLRISACHHLARKHRTPVEQLVEHHISLREEFGSIASTDEKCQALIIDEEKLRADYQGAAEKISAARKKAATRLEAQINDRLTALGMLDARLSVNISSNTNQASALGFDHIEFLVSTNPGQPFKPLSKVASGGELSRISLAIQVICAEKYATPTLVFDEVDVGVGGSIAEVVGRMLQRLSGKTQILCVTHQPQVASQADHHFTVSKISSKNSTQTKVIRLSEEGRVLEVARMLGGTNLTQASLDHAKVMLET